MLAIVLVTSTISTFNARHVPPRVSAVSPRARPLRACTITPFSMCGLEQLSTAFHLADTGTGALDERQFTQAVHASGARLGARTIAELFRELDVNGNGLIEVDEFLAPRVVKELLMELDGQAKTVIEPYQPASSTLWKRWRGTVLETTWRPALSGMLAGAVLASALRLAPWPACPLPTAWAATWRLCTAPDPKHPLIARLLPLSGVWDKLLTLTSFVVTVSPCPPPASPSVPRLLLLSPPAFVLVPVQFFVGQALAFWRGCYQNARSVASRLSDLNLVLAAHARRQSACGPFTDEAATVLATAARHSRLFHILYWASLMQRYDAAASDAGLRLLEARGHCTAAERAVLEQHAQKQRHHAVLAWLVAAGQPTGDGVAPRGLVDLDGGYWMDRCCALRSAYGKIGQALAARMPLEYMHLVQILVDTLLVLAPFAMFARFGTTSIPLIGVLVCFYRGLVNVSKSFLDPFGNAGTKVEINVPVLVRDANAASTRFLESGRLLPAVEEAN